GFAAGPEVECIEAVILGGDSRMEVGEELLVIAHDRSLAGEQIAAAECNTELLGENIGLDREENFAGVESVHGVKAQVRRRRLNYEWREQVLVAEEDAASGGKQVAVLEQSERVAGNVGTEREGDFTTGQDVHGVESKVRHGREGADRSKQVGIVFDDSTGSGDEVTSLNYVRGLRPGSSGEKNGGREPDLAHGRGGQTESERVRRRAVGLGDGDVHHRPPPVKARGGIGEIADLVREAVVD